MLPIVDATIRHMFQCVMKYRQEGRPVRLLRKEQQFTNDPARLDVAMCLFRLRQW